MAPALVFPPVVHINCERFNICAHGFINRPYLFVFDRIQVIGEDTVFQGSGFKKRPGGSAESDASKRFCPDAGPSNPRPPHDDDL